MASNVAFYLKYRPQTLDELIGQEPIKKTLLASFQNNKLAHAYLFVGPRGTGKTSTARILAKMVNCPVEQNPPCNKCSTCLSITDGSNLDLIEIDAASNRGIEDMRSLRDKIKLAPTNSKKKVYIIDEVHMLTTEAFNALLKTLEEPPAHVLFVLATTEGSKVPQTILSRVQRLDFKLASTQELSQALEKIVKAEKIDIDEEALKSLISKSDGSFRDAVKLLDQLAATGGRITIKTIVDNFKSSHFENIIDLIVCFADKNATNGLLCLQEQLVVGTDVKELILGLMGVIRNLVLIKNGVGEQLVKPYLTEEKYQKLVDLNKGFAIGDLVKDLNILQLALEQLKFASIQSLPLELAVIEICEGGPKLEGIANPEVAKEMDEGSDALLANDSNNESSKLVSDTSSQEVSSDSPDIVKLQEKWTFVLETIRPYNFSLEALLRSVHLAKSAENNIYLEVPYAFHQRILEAPKNRDLLEGVFSDILGKSIKISVILGNRPPRKDDIANVEIAGDDEIIRAAAEIFNSDTVN